MLDMGGMASASVDTSLDVGKNNKVKAIALDFDLITRSIGKDKQKVVEEMGGKNPLKEMNNFASADKKSEDNSNILPDTVLVQDMAKLLNVQLGDENTEPSKKRIDEKDDDLSLLLGSPEQRKDKSKAKSEEKREVSNFDPSATDIRSRYAAKLRSKVEGGLAGVELAKSKKEESLKMGDAAGHLVARSIAASNTVSTSGSKWMASTGVGSLCSFLSNRSMKIALIPTPSLKNNDEVERIRVAMQDLSKQLPQVKFTLLGMDKDTEGRNAKEILESILSRIEAEPISTIVVSDRDDYLGSARDLGIFTCRIRKKNAPRGNITTNYSVERADEVIDVVNELNGISYNTVFNQ